MNTLVGALPFKVIWAAAAGLGGGIAQLWSARPFLFVPISAVLGALIGYALGIWVLKRANLPTNATFMD
jgi:hypothetical protein